MAQKWLEWFQNWQKRHKKKVFWFILFFLCVLILVVSIKADNWADWTGFGSDESISRTITQRDANGNVIETRTITSEPGKTFWDWLSLLGVPLTLLIFGYGLQRRDQERIRQRESVDRQREEKAAEIQEAEKLAEKERTEAIISAEKERAEAIAKEEVVQLYFDRLSSLLVDKNLLSIAVNSQRTVEQQDLLDIGLDIIRARTLAVLRRFEGDSRRKGSVIAFLAETEIMTKTNLSLVGADISKTDLSNITLKNTNLSHLNFRGAVFHFANLTDVDFSYADLRETKFIGAEIKGVDFSHARLQDAEIGSRDLTGVTFDSTELYRAELQQSDFTKAHSIKDPYFFSGAILCHSIFKGLNLSEANFNDADLRYADFSGANLDHSYLIRSKLKRTDFSEANLTEAELEDAELPFAILKKTILCCAFLWKARLYKASLESALMIKTDLDGADVKEANFRNAVLIDIDLRSTKNLTSAQLEDCYICGVKLPSDVTGIQADRDCQKLPKILMEEYGYSFEVAQKIITDAMSKYR